MRRQANNIKQARGGNPFDFNFSINFQFMSRLKHSSYDYLLFATGNYVCWIWMNCITKKIKIKNCFCLRVLFLPLRKRANLLLKFKSTINIVASCGRKVLIIITICFLYSITNENSSQIFSTFYYNSFKHVSIHMFKCCFSGACIGSL